MLLLAVYMNVRKQINNTERGRDWYLNGNLMKIILVTTAVTS